LTQCISFLSIPFQSDVIESLRHQHSKDLQKVVDIVLSHQVNFVTIVTCARTLIFGSFSFITFLSVFYFYSPFFSLFFVCVLVFYCISPFFCLFFYHAWFPPFFFTLVLSVFRLMWVSSLAYPNLLGTKRLVVVVVCVTCVQMITEAVCC
jgi:hypothetical protein